MLVLSRKVNEEIVIGNNIHIKIVRLEGNRVRLGISAPEDVTIRRSEVAFETGEPQPAAERSKPARLLSLC